MEVYKIHVGMPQSRGGDRRDVSRGIHDIHVDRPGGVRHLLALLAKKRRKFSRLGRTRVLPLKPTMQLEVVWDRGDELIENLRLESLPD